MKYSQYLLLVLLITIVNNLTGCIGSRQGESVDLAELILSPKKLPPGTHLVEVSEGDKLPFGMEENPTVSEDRAFIAAFSKGLFGDAVESENISKALYACYKEENEVGIFAFRFTELQTAKTAMQQLPQEENKYHVLKRDILVYIWHDGVSEAVFQAYKQHVTSALENGKTEQRD
ncbi:MAG: hypothetical protein ACYSWZ_18880 [Planctomycetota bacterium]|jgi:hypothetical protein